jgi:hypothetical protein
MPIQAEEALGPISIVERLSPSSHVKEPSVTAHYEHYAHDEWSIGDLLHWLNYPSMPITFPCFESMCTFPSATKQFRTCANAFPND